MKKLQFLLLSLLYLSCVSSRASADTVSLPGTLKQTAACVAFLADDGGLYQLDRLGGFQAGDHVLVIGERDLSCRPCDGIGCISVTSILAPGGARVPDRVSSCGTLTSVGDCNVWQQDGGPRFVLPAVPESKAGDRLFVYGQVDLSCAPACDAAGCIAKDAGCFVSSTGCEPGSSAGGPAPFDACGQLIAIGECVLFRTDAGTDYVLENHGGLRPGQRVRIIGRLDERCWSVCPSAGCIRDNAISAADLRTGCKPPPEREVNTCGQIIQGAECLLLQTDDGSQYVLSNTAAFQAGDRVHVKGVLQPQCATTCLQGNGCIRVTLIDDAAGYDCASLPPPRECGAGLCGTGAASAAIGLAAGLVMARGVSRRGMRR